MRRPPLIFLSSIALFAVGCSSDSPSTLPTASSVALIAVANAGPLQLNQPTAWPAAMHDARHSGTSSAVGPRSGVIAWQRDLGANATPGPVIGIDGSVITATNAGVLYALDPADGSSRWEFDAGSGYGSDLSTSAAILGDGTILWPGPSGTLYGINPTGEQLWKLKIGGFVLSPAVATTGRIYLTTMSGVVSAVDLTDSTPTIAWTFEVGGTSYGSPSIGIDGTVFATSSTEVVAIADQGESAAELWRFGIDDLIEVSPAVGPDGTVVIGTNDPFQYGLDPATGAVRWKLPRAADSYSSAIVTSDGHAYYGDHTATLYVVDVRTGALIRSTTTVAKVGGRSWGIWTAPAIDAEGAAFYGTRSGHIFGVGADGIELFDIEVGGTVDSYPAIGPDGSLYIGTSTGTFTAIAPG
jgi:outer membrane protein assembly factor BamB